MTTAAKIRWGWGTGLALAFLNLTIALIGHATYGTRIGGSSNTTEFTDRVLHAGLWTLLDVAIIAACTVAIVLKSRAGAVCLLCYFIIFPIYLAASGAHISAASWILKAAICIPLWLGVQGTFEAHRAAQPAPDPDVPRSF